MIRVTKMFATLVTLAAVASGAAGAQTASELFQQALQKERVDGDLKAAISLYQRILNSQPADRSIAAAVLVQLGEAYEKQGSAGARSAYQRVLREFGDQAGPSARAQERSLALSSSSGVAGRQEPVLHRVWVDAQGPGRVTPDGRVMSFADRRTGRLGVRDLVTGAVRMLTDTAPRPWQTYALGNVPSRDGQHIAYAWFAQDHPVELRVISGSGGEPRVLYLNSEIEFVAPEDWSPDAKQILAFLGRKDHTGQVALISTRDGSVRTLKTLGWRAAPGYMEFSPDGKFIAYSFAPHENSRQRDIYVLATDASSESVFASGPEDERFLGWTPDGKHLLFKTGVESSLWLARIEGGRRVGAATLVRRNAGGR